MISDRKCGFPAGSSSSVLLQYLQQQQQPGGVFAPCKWFRTTSDCFMSGNFLPQEMLEHWSSCEQFKLTISPSPKPLKVGNLVPPGKYTLEEGNLISEISPVRMIMGHKICMEMKRNPPTQLWESNNHPCVWNDFNRLGGYLKRYNYGTSMSQ